MTPLPLDGHLGKGDHPHMALGMRRFKTDAELRMEALLRDPILERTNLAEIAAKAYTSELLSGLMEMYRDDTNPLNLRVKIALELLNRGWGKPAVAIRITNDRDKDEAVRTIDAELEQAEQTSQEIMALAKQGGNAKFWLEPSPKALMILDQDVPDDGTQKPDGSSQ